MVVGNFNFTVKFDFTGSQLITSQENEETGDPFDPISKFTTVDAMGLIVKLDTNNEEYTNVGVDIKSIKVNGKQISMTGTPYSNMEDGMFRANIYNSYGSFDKAKADHKSKDPATATATPFSADSFVGATSIEVNFDVYGMKTDKPGGSPAPTNPTTPTDPANPTNPSNPAKPGDNKGKPTPNAGTGIESVAAIAAIALIAGGAVVISRKKK